MPLQDTYDEELLGAIAELLPILATALGPTTYVPVFQQLVIGPLMKRLQPGQPDGVRSTMIGAFDLRFDYNLHVMNATSPNASF